MSVRRKKGSPYWHYDFHLNGRQRGSTKQTTKGAALKVEAALIQKLNSGVDITKKTPLLRDFAVSFLAFVKQSRRSEKTKQYYKEGWNLLKSQPIAGMRIDAIKTSTAEVLKIPGSGSNVNKALRTLRRMLSIACERDLIAKVPKIHLVEENEREALIEASTEAIILAKAPRVLRDAYLLIADCGIRPNDAVALSWEDVDFVNSQILIAGGKTGKKGRRFVGMSSRVREMLVERARMTTTWVFPSVKRSRSGKHMTAHGLSARFSEFKRLNGLPDAIVLYSARHTFATDVQEATGDLTKTQKALGHTQLSTTRRYVHTQAPDTGKIMDQRNQERQNVSGTIN